MTSTGAPTLARDATVVSPAPREAWHQALESTPASVVTQTPQWLSCLQAAGPWRDASRLYALPGGRRLVVPLVERGRGRLATAASWPYGWGNGGILASDGRVSSADAALVAEDLARYRGARLSVFPAPPQHYWEDRPAGARSESRYLTQVLPLTGGVEQVWSGYSTNVRRSIRRAERAGLQIRRDTTGGLLPHFGELYRASVTRWARTGGRSSVVAQWHARFAEPPRRLAAISQVLGESCVAWAAFLDDRPVAAIIVLQGERHSLYWRGAMDRDAAARTHANALLHHRAIEEAVGAGHSSYSFGESDESSALAEYKAKFGAEPVRWSAYHFGSLPVTELVSGARSLYRTGSRLVGSVAQSRGRT